MSSLLSWSAQGRQYSVRPLEGAGWAIAPPSQETLSLILSSFMLLLDKIAWGSMCALVILYIASGMIKSFL